MTNLAHLPEHPKPRRAAGMQAILIIGAGGGLEIIALQPGVDPEAQLAARSRRLWRGQRAQLVALTVLGEVHA